jgi:hypothetical protein
VGEGHSGHRRDFRLKETITVKLKTGRVLEGRYRFADGNVTNAHGSKTAELGSMPINGLARLLLRQLASEGKA